MTDSHDSDAVGASADSEMAGLIRRLEGELAESTATTAVSRKVGIALVVIIGLYLCWVTVQVNRLSDPEELALAAAGAAMEATPVLGNHLRSVVVEGAPDLARLATTSVVDMIPAYREVAEAELSPLIDGVSEVLAQTAMSRLSASLEAGASGGAQSAALQAATDAAVARLEAVLSEAMDEPIENDGPSPRQTIEATLSQLQVIDRGLKRVAQNSGDPIERELILSWLVLISQQSDVAELSAREEYRHQSQRAAAAVAPAATEGQASSAEEAAPAGEEAPKEPETGAPAAK